MAYHVGQGQRYERPVRAESPRPAENYSLGMGKTRFPTAVELGEGGRESVAPLRGSRHNRDDGMVSDELRIIDSSVAIHMGTRQWY